MVNISSYNSPKEKIFCKHNNFCFKDPENKMFTAFLYSLCHYWQSYPQFSHSVFQTLCHPTDCSMPGFPVPHEIPELAQTHVHRVSDAIQPSYPLSSPSLPAFSLASIRVFSSESVLHIRWPKYWGFSFIISPSNEYSELISSGVTGLISLKFKGLSRIFSNTTVQNINSSVLSFLHSPTLTSIHDYWKTIALTRWNFVDKVMSVLFNMLSRFVIAFLPKSKHLLISCSHHLKWFWSPPK